MEEEQSYCALLQKGWASSPELASMDSVLKAIGEMKDIGESPEKFRVDFLDEGEQLALEVHSDLRFVVRLRLSKQIHGKAKNWLEVEVLCRLFLKRRFEELTKRIENYPVQQSI
ncbi:hypothetical protein [uncultured Pontibacter sp.]|uniref:hypothetical protein n=1 Tax=uncultured Pontibacter sp. TaxID=453356 RepID=UPI00260967EF|nr:hypothetical protein [uncultured Pontibacter sp.]